jgi:predicted nucleic acid-binding protein
MLRVMIDADVLFAGAASSSGQSASGVVLRLSELTVIEGVASEQVVAETTRNLEAKVPAAVPALRQLVGACLHIVPDPETDEVAALDGRAHPKDLPILTAAVRERCDVLVTFNERDYRPGHEAVEVVTPGVLVQRVRRSVAALAGGRGDE